jgi:LmbE family N-acetylglucosaminyl deacetylase
MFTSLQQRLEEPDLKIAILAAHPDDETIGASVLLAHHPSARIIYLTDGAPRDPRFWSPAVQGSREHYAEVRREEARTALAFAGIPFNGVSWLGAVDQEAIFQTKVLTEALVDLLIREPVDCLLTHAYEGGHPDHDAAALIASNALNIFPACKPPQLLEMTSYHAENGSCVTGKFLHPDPASAAAFDLSHSDRERKHHMIAAYDSQRLVLENFPIQTEWVRRAPRYDFAQPPHQGKLWYECMGWPMTGARWRELATPSLTRVQEFSCR